MTIDRMKHETHDLSFISDKSSSQSTNLAVPEARDSENCRDCKPSVWDGRILADARAIPLANESVQCVVTSPPYWGLRDYGSAGQIGREDAFQDYIESLRLVASELSRVLKTDGTFWLNLGDCYYSGNRGGYRNDSHRWEKSELQRGNRGNAQTVTPNRLPQSGLKSKDLVGIPWRVAFALQQDGWYLRSDIIWAKKNCMPESVTDRPTRSHEYIFLLTKSERYFYDAASVAELAVHAGDTRHLRADTTQPQRERAKQDGHSRRHDGFNSRYFTGKPQAEKRNRRDVWHIGTRPYPKAHYATFPEEIPEICIRAGSRPGDLILDPFFGSGTVGRVAERLSRRWVGMDLGYQDLQAKRLKNIQREIVEFSS